MNRKEREERQERVTAYYMSGSTVTALHFSRKVNFVTIKPGKNSLGHLSSRRPRWFKAGGNLNDARVRIYIEDSIIMSFVGLEAERKFLGKPKRIGKSVNYDRILEVGLQVCDSKAIANAYLKYLHLQAKELINNPFKWAAIEAVAEALCRQKRLTGEQVYKIASEAIQNYTPVEQA